MPIESGPARFRRPVPRDCRRAERGVWGQDNLIPPRLTPDFDYGVGSTGKGERPGRRAALSWSQDKYSPATRELVPDPIPAPAIDRPSPSDLDALLGSTASVAQEVS